jgi:hypothetical protein
VTGAMTGPAMDVHAWSTNAASLDVMSDELTTRGSTRGRGTRG